MSAQNIRLRDAGDARLESTRWMEAFYDFIFAGALVCHGPAFAATPSFIERASIAFCGLALWLCWLGVRFFQNRFAQDDLLHRGLLLVQMAAAAVVAFSSLHAFEGESLRSYLVGAALVSTGIMYARARRVPEAEALASLWASVFVAVGVSWLVAPLFSEQPLVLLSGAATIIGTAVPLATRSRALFDRHPIDFKHIAAGFTRLHIGSVVVIWTMHLTGARQPPVLAIVLFTAGAYSAAWLYFEALAGAPLKPGRSKWIVWLYSHVPLQLSLVLLGVGVGRAFSSAAGEPLGAQVRWLLAGGLALLLLSVATIDSVVDRGSTETPGEAPPDTRRIHLRWTSAAAAVALAVFGDALASVAFCSLVAALALAQTLWGGETKRVKQTSPVRPALEKTRRIVPGTDNVVRKGAPSFLRRDLYFYLVDGSWMRVMVLFGIAFVLTNLIFATLFWLEPGAVQGGQFGSFADAFALSVQTMSTIGYGALSPGSAYGDVLVAIEAAVTMLGIAIVTGFVVAKATRPKASVLFSEVLTISQIDGKRTLSFRVGNARGNEVVDANITVSALMEETTAEGQNFRRVHDLVLRRSRTPAFTLTWSIFHELDESSPLADVDWKDPESKLLFLIVSITGHDGTYGQTIYARHNYMPEDARVDECFVDVMMPLEDGRMLIDYTRFHQTEPQEPTNVA